MEESNGKGIGKLISGFIPIEWMRYNMYIEEDRYRNIPMLVFRVHDSCPKELVDDLKGCVDTFKGKLNWKLFKDPLSKRGNYVITIAEMETFHKECFERKVHYDQIKYFGKERYEKYCNDAIHDIPNLSKHIYKTFCR